MVIVTTFQSNCNFWPRRYFIGPFALSVATLTGEAVAQENADETLHGSLSVVYRVSNYVRPLRSRRS
jgi:hypothetical protein